MEKAGTGPAGDGRRIPSLDGLRAISILLVLLGHLAGTRGYPLSKSTATDVLDYANLGVRAFFVISGFLITGLLLSEARRRGTVSLPRFYLRRTLRIFPPFYVFLVIMLGLILAGVAKGTPYAFLRAATYTGNYSVRLDWAYGHTWSLAVEEQFYLLWPATIVLLGIRRSTLVALAVIALAPLVRVAELAAPAGWQLAIFSGRSFETTADALAAGCLLAMLREPLWRIGAYRRFTSSRAVWLLIPTILVTAAMQGTASESAFLWLFAPITDVTGIPATRALHAAWFGMGMSIINLSIAVLVDRVTRFPETTVGHALNWGPMVWIGTLSYSLYLWQELFLDRSSSFWFAAFPLNIVLAFAAASASYYAVERPVLRFRQRLEGRLRPRAAATSAAAPVGVLAD